MRAAASKPRSESRFAHKRTWAVPRSGPVPTTGTPFPPLSRCSVRTKHFEGAPRPTKCVVSTLLLRTSLTASVDGCSEHAEARRTGLLGKQHVRQDIHTDVNATWLGVRLTIYGRKKGWTRRTHGDRPLRPAPPPRIAPVFPATGARRTPRSSPVAARRASGDGRRRGPLPSARRRCSASGGSGQTSARSFQG